MFFIRSIKDIRSGQAKFFWVFDSTPNTCCAPITGIPRNSLTRPHADCWVAGFSPRTILTQAWADTCDALETGAEVIELHKTA